MTIEASSPLSERIPFIGRDNIVDKIIAAIKEAAPSRWMFYVTGAAGIGKTRLQEEIGRRVEALPDYDCKWAGIIDLYHTEFHSPGGVRQAIIEALDPNNQHFQAYRQMRKEFEEKRERGFSGQAIEKLRQQLDETFRSDYTALAKESCRVVLTLDTVEFMQYESDSVQEICRVEEEGTIVKNWLLEQVSQLPNTVVVLAGRPRPKMEAQFVSRYKNLGWQVETLELIAFTMPETRAYLTEMANLLVEQGLSRQPREYAKNTQALAKTIRDTTTQNQLHQISQGRPIYLAIILDLIRSDTITFGDIFETLTANPKDVGNKLVELYISLEQPWHEIVYWLIRARKGLDARLLQALTNWSDETIQQDLSLARILAIVKYREKTGQLFLHDEIYDRVDQYYHGDPRFIASFEPLVKYYRQLGDPLELDSDTLIARLYYELRLDPRRGYHEFYARWDEEAVQRHDVGRDMRLRDEVLHFLNRYTEGDLKDPTVISRVDRAGIDRDCAVRWVKRYVGRGQYTKADEVAQSLRNNKSPLFDWETIHDPLYKASLLTAWSEARLAMGRPENAVRPLLREALVILNEDRAWTPEEKWWQIRILGEAYHNTGLMFRKAQKIHEAIKYYSAAINQYRQTDMKAAMITTLSYRAYAYAVIGNFAHANVSISDAINLLRAEIQIPYLLAQSLNTRASIFLRSGNPSLALSDYEEALSILTELGEENFLAFVHSGLGRTYRMLGNQWQTGNLPPHDVETYYQQSLDFIRKTQAYFSKFGGPSEMTLWAALEESKLERNWGLFKRSMERYEEATQKFEISLALLGDAAAEQSADWTLQRADSIEDEVDVYVIMARFAEAESKIREAEAAIPPEYHLVSGQGLKSIPEPVIEFWAILGRLEMHRARISMLKTFGTLPHVPQSSPPMSANQSLAATPEARLRGLKEAMFHYAKALAYFNAFSDRRSIQEQTFREIYNVLKGHGLAVLQDVREQVKVVEETYKVNLESLLTQIDDVLGVAPGDQTDLML